MVERPSTDAVWPLLSLIPNSLLSLAGRSLTRSPGGSAGAAANSYLIFSACSPVGLPHV